MEIRRSYDRLISTMRFPILIRHLYIESGPWGWLCLLLITTFLKFLSWDIHTSFHQMIGANSNKSTTMTNENNSTIMKHHLAWSQPLFTAITFVINMIIMTEHLLWSSDLLFIFYTFLYHRVTLNDSGLAVVYVRWVYWPVHYGILKLSCGYVKCDI